MKKLFKVCRDGKWEEVWLDVEEVKDPFIKYTPPKDMIPPVMGFLALLMVFSGFAFIVAVIILFFT